MAKRRLERESELLQRTSTAGGIQVDTVTADDSLSSAVGPTLVFPVEIEGVQVNALVDTDSQSTIISRQVLHEIGKHLHSQGKPLPKLEKPSARLYGKDGQRQSTIGHYGADNPESSGGWEVSECPRLRAAAQ